MKMLPTALAAVLLLLCAACNQRHGANHRLSNADVTITQLDKTERPHYAPAPSTSETSKFTPPVLKKDEEIRDEEVVSQEGVKDQNIVGPPVSKNSVRMDSTVEAFNTEEYASIVENKFSSPVREPLSTFSIDVDAASYSNVRRYINGGALPPAGAVRLAELINYFDYSYAQPVGDTPFSVQTEVAECPWNAKHALVHIGLQGKEIPIESLPAANLVFLIDVSGSMDEADKLPLVKTSLEMLVEQLREKDRVAIVVYAGNAGLVLPTTPGTDKPRIREAIDHLEAGGSTAGGEGIALAYSIAKKNFVKGGNNRVILATDGDFNVGPSSDDALVRLIEKERQSGVYLSVLGYGVGNYKASKMEQLADKGNGNHYYIDNEKEARKVLVSEMGGTLYTIAKDVKIQVEFNPAKVAAYRLIGYENRLLAAEDFNDDRKDAGELGSGHRVTALYEVIPAGVKDTFLGKVDNLKYQQPPKAVHNGDEEWLTIKLRYKRPEEDVSRLLAQMVEGAPVALKQASENFRFSAAVAEFGLLLRNSAYREQSNYRQVLALAEGSTGKDINGYRAEFVSLVAKAASISKSVAGN